MDYTKLINQTKNGETPLQYAIKAGDVANVRLLLKLKCNVNPLDASSPLITALDWCDKQQKADIVKLLLKHGAQVNLIHDNSRITPLNVAIESGDEEIVKLLLENGANPLHKDDSNVYPLFLAAEKGYASICKMLLERGAYVNHKTTYVVRLSRTLNSVINCESYPKVVRGHTTSALHIATDNAHPSVVALLLEHDADVNYKDGHDVLPLELGCIEGHKEVVEVFLNHTDTPLGSWRDYCDNYLRWGLAQQRARKEFFELFVRHYVKISVVSSDVESDLENFFKVKKNLFHIWKRVLSFREICGKEIEEMKSETISPKHPLTLYDVLTHNCTEDLDGDAVLACEKLVFSTDYEKRFPIYAGMLNRRAHNVLRTRLLKVQVDPLFSSSGLLSHFTV